jgi:hypothetical protein
VPAEIGALHDRSARDVFTKTLVSAVTALGVVAGVTAEDVTAEPVPTLFTALTLKR